MRCRCLPRFPPRCCRSVEFHQLTCASEPDATSREASDHVCATMESVEHVRQVVRRPPTETGGGRRCGVRAPTAASGQPAPTWPGVTPEGDLTSAAATSAFAQE